MATKFQFGDKLIQEPGTASRTISGIKNPALSLPYSNGFLIDTGIYGAGFGGGAGVLGTLKNKKTAIENFSDIDTFRNKIRGGELWRAAKWLWRPSKDIAIKGISQLGFIKAAETVPAEISYSFSGGVTVADLAWVAGNIGITTTQIISLYKDGSNILYAGTVNNVYKSTDGGLNWAATGAITGTVYQIVQTTGTILYAATSVGVYKTTNGGTAWVLSNTGLSNTFCNAIAKDSLNNLYVSTASGVYKSIDAAANWTVTAYTFFGIAIAISSVDEIYVGPPYQGMKKSSNGGATFSSINTGLVDIASMIVNTIFISGTDIFLGANNGIYKSSDAGATWTQYNTGLTNLNVLSFAKNSSGYIFASTPIGIFRSVNTGVSWELQTTNFPASSNAPLVMNSTQILYGGTDSLGTYKTGATTGGTPNGGTLVIQCRLEGVVGNGAENADNILTKGFSGLMKAGPNAASTPDKFIIEFCGGVFKGLDADGDPYDGILEEDILDQQVLATSVEFSNIEDLYNWAIASAQFNEWFKVKTYVKTGTGVIDDGDLTTYASNNLAAGGTEDYTSEAMDLALETIKEIQYAALLSDNHGTGVDGAQSANNVKIWEHILNSAKYQKYLYIGGGDTEDDFNTSDGSIGSGEFYNSQRVIIVHGAFNKIKRDNSGNKLHSAFIKAAAVMGRVLGLPPQVPATFKDIDMDSDVHELTETQRVLCLDHGVLHIKNDDILGYIINQDVNSLQNNSFVVNDDGKSHLIAAERIFAQLNYEIEVNAKRQLLGQQNGPNRFTLKPSFVAEWVKTYLKSKTANTTADNLILGFEDIVVITQGDAYLITYGAYPNLEVNKLLFTQMVLDKNI